MFQYASKKNSYFLEEKFKFRLKVATSLGRFRMNSLDYYCTTLKMLAIFDFYTICFLIGLRDFLRVILKQYTILNKRNFSLY